MAAKEVHRRRTGKWGPPSGSGQGTQKSHTHCTSTDGRIAEGAYGRVTASSSRAALRVAGLVPLCGQMPQPKPSPVHGAEASRAL